MTLPHDEQGFLVGERIALSNAAAAMAARGRIRPSVQPVMRPVPAPAPERRAPVEPVARGAGQGATASRPVPARAAAEPLPHGYRIVLADDGKRQERLMRKMLTTLLGIRSDASTYERARRRLTGGDHRDQAVAGGGILGSLFGMLGKIPGLGRLAGLGRMARLLRRLPVVGALLAMAGAAGDIAGGGRPARAIGGAAGGIGGMLAGARLGALVGAVAGPIGAAIGTVVGGAAGMFFGDRAGRVVADKVGG